MGRNVDQVTDPADLDLLDAAILLRQRELSAEELLDASLNRISERNGGEPSFDGSPQAINAWSRIYADTAREQARQADDRLRREGSDAPLVCGIPMGLKDLYSVEGRPITASSRVLEGNIASSSAAVWRQLESDGAVLVGHTHTHEFGIGGSTDQVGNPWSLEHSAGGSSGGSAAALAAGMIPAALGTDTAGSVRHPSSMCGVSGIKPTWGRVPYDGVLPLSGSLDHVGPMARTLADCAAVLTSMIQAPRPTTPWAPLDMMVPKLPLAASTEARPLAGMRIGLTGRKMSDLVADDIVDGVERARRACADLGATIVELPFPADFTKEDYDTIMLAEGLWYHRRYEHLRDSYRGSVREFLANAVEPSMSAYLDAQQRRATLTAQWQDWFEDNAIDAVLEPTQAVTAPLRGHGYDPGRMAGGEDPMTLFTALWNATGFPVAALPTHLGSRSSLPIGISLIAARGREAQLLEIGLALQEYALPPLGIVPSFSEFPKTMEAN